MALPDVKNKILDGAMGVGGADSTGIFAAVGVSAIPSNGVLTFVDPASVEEKIGDGPLRDLIVSSLSIAKTRVYAIALEGTVPGSVKAVSAGSENAGTGTVAASGKARNEYDVRVDITSSGTLNEAAFRVTIDGSGGLKSGEKLSPLLTAMEDMKSRIPALPCASRPVRAAFRKATPSVFLPPSRRRPTEKYWRP